MGRAYLGIRLGCARCHDHPNDRWRREHHLAFSAVFPDARPAGDGGGTMRGPLFDDRFPGRTVEPSLAPVVDVDRSERQDLETLRRALRDDPRVARALANRILAALNGGRGVVEPLDDHRPTNPPVHPELLEAATEQLVALDFDLRAFVLATVASEWFASTSTPRPGDSLDVERAHFLARRTATALDDATWHRAAASALGVELTAPADREADSPLSRELARWNGPAVQKALNGTRGNTIDVLAEFETEPAAQLEGLFVACLSRVPTDTERDALLPRLRASDEPRTFLRNLAHALLASREGTSLR